MNLIALYLQEFNREYRLTSTDRRQTRHILRDFLATTAAIILLGFLLYAWQA
jgi:hypothetical protein